MKKGEIGVGFGVSGSLSVVFVFKIGVWAHLGCSGSTQYIIQDIL